ncbi:hypothetical protein [Nitrosomonas sp. Nm33]|uniref:hypothetical protein n=1 Tax=Nitrosomonas sp. Nm33 TaxID=133724 RepID=UPI000895B4CF|nr:hypothetical protein [Nitrosomonas sp. Nm33]SDX99150.1 hypothetical protein SAMN05421755_100443 [Nitrosomonas sp. Nm33]
MAHDSLGGGHGHGHGNSNGHGNGHDQHGNGHGYGHEQHGNGHGYGHVENFLNDHMPDHVADAHSEHFNLSEPSEYLVYSRDENSEHSEHSENSENLNLNVEHENSNGGSDSLVGGHGNDIFDFNALGDDIAQIDNGDMLPISPDDIPTGADLQLFMTDTSETHSNVTPESTDGESSITLVGVPASEITTHMETFDLS